MVGGRRSVFLVTRGVSWKRPSAGTTIHNVELRPGKGAQMVRSAGGSAQLVAKESEYALVKLPSGETRKVLIDCMATIDRSATSITKTFPSAKRDATSGWARSRSTAAWP